MVASDSRCPNQVMRTMNLRLFSGSISLKELFVVAVIASLLLFFLLPAINIYENARSAAAPTIAYRVMDSIESFQEKHRQKTGNYAEGRFDRNNGDESIREAIGWRPSNTGTALCISSNRFLDHNTK